MTDKELAYMKLYGKAFNALFTGEERMSGDLNTPAYAARQELVAQVDSFYAMARDGETVFLPEFEAFIDQHRDSVEDIVVISCRIIDLEKERRDHGKNPKGAIVVDSTVTLLNIIQVRGVNPHYA